MDLLAEGARCSQWLEETWPAFKGGAEEETLNDLGFLTADPRRLFLLCF